MKWSVKIAEISGIGIYVHATFLILLAWFGVSYWVQAGSLAVMVEGLAFIVVLFGCVVLHELGHALTAKRYGVKTRDITLLPIGGVARLERMPDDPRQEFWVALAGPAVNVVIAAALFLWLRLTAGFQPLEQIGMLHGSFAQRLMLINLFLVGFNLLPAFPMDGGRVLRALLAMRMRYDKATQIAAGLGQAMAYLFGFIGFFGNPILLFIAFFVWIGAAQEASMTQMKVALGGIPVGHAMITDFRTLAPGDPLKHAVDLILAGTQQDFPVVEGERVIGILTRADLLSALARGEPDTDVGRVMETSFQSVDQNEMLEVAFNRLQACECHTLPVTRLGKLAGMITSENLGEFLMIQAAMDKAQARRPAVAV